MTQQAALPTPLSGASLRGRLLQCLGDRLFERHGLPLGPCGGEPILIQDGEKTHFLQTGEMILCVGRAWKLIEGPSSGPGGVPLRNG